MRKLKETKVATGVQTLKGRQQSDLCRLVYEASVGRSMQQVANLMGFTRQRVCEHLRGAAFYDAIGAMNSATTFSSDDICRIIKTHGPKEPDKEYVVEQTAAGHTPEVARVFATAYESAERALDAGAIPETVKK